MYKWLIAILVVMSFIEYDCNAQVRFFLPSRERNPEEDVATPVVEFTSLTFQDDEDAGTSTVVSLTRTGVLSGSSEVSVSITGGTAIAPGDYTNTSFPLTITFTAGQSSKTVSIPITNDSDVESPETILLQVTATSGCTIGTIGSTTFTIVDNDLPPDVAFSQSTNYQANESDGATSVLTLTRSGDLSATSEVQVSITGGTATGDTDYTDDFPKNITFAEDDTSATVPLTITEDGDAEGTSETITFSVSSVDNATIVAPSTATLEIVDNDGYALPQNDLSGKTNHLSSNANINGTTGWALEGTATYDSGVTRTADGSGSIYITGESTANKAWSPFIDLTGEPEGYYQFTFFARSASVRNSFGAQVPSYDSGFTSQGNIGQISWADIGEANTWTEITTVLWVDPVATPNLRLQVFAREQPNQADPRYFDDFSLVKIDDYPPLPLFNDAPYTPKQTFSSSLWRIDELGNWQRYNGSEWVNFFLFGMHPNSGRTDYSVYADNGFNTVVWTNTDAALQLAVDQGLFGMLQVSQYTQPIQGLYNDTTTLNSRLDAMIASGNISSLLGWWWDAEDADDEWQVPRDMIAAMRAKAPGRPVVQLEGNWNRLAYAHDGIVDVSGVYSAIEADHVGNESETTAQVADQRTIQDLPGNPIPGTVPLLSGMHDGHPGDWRLSVYNNILEGARGVVFYGDNLVGSAVAFESQPWFTDGANVKSEIETLLPLIREPHWTTGWGATSDTDNVRVATRNMGSREFVWLVNQTSSAQAVTITLTGSPTANNLDDVVNYFTSAKVTDVDATPSFTVTLPAIGVNSGTAVYELVEDGGAPSIDYTFNAQFNDTDASPLTDPYVAEVGSLDVVEGAGGNDGTLATTGGNLVVTEPTTGLSFANMGVISVGTFNRAYGQVFKAKVNFSHVDSCVIGPSLLSTVDQNTIGGFRIETGDIYYNVGGSIFIVNATNLATSTDYELIVTQDEQADRRCALLIKGGVFTDWTLLGCFQTSTNTTARAMLSNYDAALTMDYLVAPQTSSISYFPASCLNDTFDGADTSTLRNSDGGVSGNNAGGGVSYTESVGDMEHDTNRLESVGASEAIVTTDVGQTDLCWEFTVQAPSGGVHGFVYRYTDSNNYFVCGLDIADGDYKIVEVTAGTPATLATIAASQAADTDVVIRGIVSGNDHRIWVGTSTATATDASNNTATTVGFKAASVDAVQFDDVLVWPLTHNDVPTVP